jgi:uncharacterized membrane protein YphA (DoxX/SURF4 family)
LQKLYSTFPGGMLGVGLLILRTTAGVGTALFGGILVSRLEMFGSSQFSYFSHLILGLLLISGGVFLILGLMMPFVSIVVAVCQLIAAYIRLKVTDPPQGGGFDWITLLLLASITIALFFLRPGAYSVDARLYGRRRIFIPSSKKEESEES